MRIHIFLLTFLMFLPAVSAVTVEEIEKDVICACGCGKILENCNCGSAQTMRSEIAQMISMGYSRDMIIKELQNMYGKEILANPPKEGFFLSLWMYPVVGIGAGLVVIYILSKRRNARWFVDPDEVLNMEEDEFDLEKDEDEFEDTREERYDRILRDEMKKRLKK